MNICAHLINNSTYSLIVFKISALHTYFSKQTFTIISAMQPRFNFSVETLITENRVSGELIEEIKQWARSVSSFPDLCDEQVALFLLSCNNELKNTKNTITAYYKIKRNCPELFDGRDLEKSDLQHQLTVLLVLFYLFSISFIELFFVIVILLYYQNVQQMAL